MNGHKASRLLIDDQPLILLPRLALAIGLQEALVLQQVHYWLAMHEKNQDSRHFFEGRYWIYNSYAKWLEQFPFWSDRTLRAVFRRLEKPFKPRKSDPRLPRGPLLLTGNFNREYRRDAWDRTKWYSIERDELARLDAATSTWQDLPHGVGKVAHIVPANSTDSKKDTETSASEKSSENGARPGLPAGLAGSAASILARSAGKPARQALDLNLPIRYFRDRPASPSDLQSLRQTIKAYQDDFKYDVTQRDLNAAAVNARYWWDNNRADPPRGLETLWNSLQEVITPMLHATEPSDAWLRQGTSLHPDLISPLSRWLEREPSPAEVQQVLQYVANWGVANSRGLPQSWYDTLVEQLLRDWANTHRTIELFVELARAQYLDQQSTVHRRRATK